MDEGQVASILERLFMRSDEQLYAVLDGAAIPLLRIRLFEDEPEYVCLFRGELPPDMAEVAPYLVKLEIADPFTRWLVQEGWGRSWGIYVSTDEGIRPLRTHLRKLLTVRGPDGQELHFRFYDPRVMSTFLPTCDRAQIEELFGSIKRMYVEDAETAEGPVSAVREFVRSELAKLAERTIEQ